MGRVAVIHPDLGVGGAERLIVDASRALKESGHKVKIYTGYHDKKRCFKETRDGTLDTCTVGSWIPRSIFGKCHALIAYLKIVYIAIYVTLFSNHDLILCDQVSTCIPVLKYLNFRNKGARIVFYCHFPDKLLTHCESIAKAIYRKPLDLIEEYSTGMADIILVNSKFTSSVVKRTFTTLYNRELTVLYPCVDVEHFAEFKKRVSTKGGLQDIKTSEIVNKCLKTTKDNFTFLSVNRFETKKNLALAIKALSECITGFELSNRDVEFKSMKISLIIAGGYDDRLSDCIDYYKELRELVMDLQLTPYVTFIKSPSDDEKLMLLNSSHVIVYTPENEHFGIVPLEAMAMAKPIIASASGGPLETVEDNINGLLCDPDMYSFADAMLKLYNDRTLCDRMGQAGLERAKEHFSYEAFRRKLNRICYPVS